jgi:hypothetical protein
MEEKNIFLSGIITELERVQKKNESSLFFVPLGGSCLKFSF